jgi:hypothetical protein
MSGSANRIAGREAVGEQVGMRSPVRGSLQSETGAWGFVGDSLTQAASV